MAREFVLEIIVALKGLKIKYNGGIYEWETLPFFIYIVKPYVSFNLFITFSQ